MYLYPRTRIQIHAYSMFEISDPARPYGSFAAVRVFAIRRSPERYKLCTTVIRLACYDKQLGTSSLQSEDYTIEMYHSRIVIAISKSGSSIIVIITPSIIIGKGTGKSETGKFLYRLLLES